jgi:hypothetical protein
MENILLLLLITVPIAAGMIITFALVPAFLLGVVGRVKDRMQRRRSIPPTQTTGNRTLGKSHNSNKRAA